jgi:integrase
VGPSSNSRCCRGRKPQSNLRRWQSRAGTARPRRLPLRPQTPRAGWPRRTHPTRRPHIRGRPRPSKTCCTRCRYRRRGARSQAAARKQSYQKRNRLLRMLEVGKIEAGVEGGRGGDAHRHEVVPHTFRHTLQVNGGIRMAASFSAELDGRRASLFKSQLQVCDPPHP